MSTLWPWNDLSIFFSILKNWKKIERSSRIKVCSSASLRMRFDISLFFFYLLCKYKEYKINKTNTFNSFSFIFSETLFHKLCYYFDVCIEFITVWLGFSCRCNLPLQFYFFSHHFFSLSKKYLIIILFSCVGVD